MTHRPAPKMREPGSNVGWSTSSSLVLARASYESVFCLSTSLSQTWRWLAIASWSQANYAALSATVTVVRPTRRDHGQRGPPWPG